MKTIRKIVSLLLVLVFVITSNSCGLVEKIDPGDFDEYSKRLLDTLLGNDELTIHYLFKDKEAIGKTETELSLPTPGSSSALGKIIII